jgi:hypothetical protein
VADAGVRDHQGLDAAGAEVERVVQKRGFLLKTIKTRLADPVPESIRLGVEGTNDPAKLDSWIDLAFVAQTLADLRKQMQVEP